MFSRLLQVLGLCLFFVSVASAAESLKIQTIRPGDGESVKSGSIVKVHYTGWLTDSTRFDSSRDRGEPLEFTLGAGMVIAGWDKGILGMKAGEIRKLVIPADLAYGERAVGPIPSFSVLVFEVELVSFAKGLEPDAFPKDYKAFGWKTLSPGVDVFQVTAGQGAPAKAGTRINLHYTGWLLGGTTIGSSKTTGKPIAVTLGMNKVIRGWEVGLDGAQAGSTLFLRLQPNVAYGGSALPRVPPGSVLLYRIEVVSLEDDEEAAAGVDFFPELDKLKMETGREGLQYSVVQVPAQDGEAAKAGQKVQVHYTGWLLDGTLFDSSRGRGTPFDFPLGAGRVIRGWDLGVEGMRPGEKRVFLIPPGLGYGSRGAGPIPPDATLVFLVEFVGVSE